MAHFDLSLEELQGYSPQVREEEDFDLFWQNTLSEVRRKPLKPEFQEITHPFKNLKIYDVSFGGFGGQRVKGWFIRPSQEAMYPCLLEFIGYGGGRSLPHEWTRMASAGMAHFIMDTRGQGSYWSPGDTADPELEPGNSQFPGFMTRGILKRETYYYRRVFCDAVRAFDTLLTRTDVDGTRIAVTGGSQGGGISIAAAGLIPELQMVLADVPFLCHFARAVRLMDSDPYGEIKNYLKTHRDKVEEVFRCLSYFDGVNFSKRIKARSFFSTALMDDICPPSTVFAAYNQIPGEKEIQVWEFNGHEGGGPFQIEKKLEHLCRIWEL